MSERSVSIALLKLKARWRLLFSGTIPGAPSL